MKHPNATVALVTGSGGGSLVAWLLDDVAHLNVSAAACAAIAGVVAAAALFVGRNGLKGVWNKIINGSGATV